ncbi:MAG: hypothetical protein JWO68_2467 [Actinomycetia bacterium]|nr:hypothetical protein [Actinomycetes bacterium]
MQDERGSVAPLVALLVVAVGGLCLGLGRMGGVATAKAQAQTAADAAALAAAADGPSAAGPMARANGAEVVRVEPDGDEVTVVVRLGQVTAAARATGRGEAGAVTEVTGLVPELRAALAEAERLLGEEVPVTSGWRSYARQQQLYDDRGTNPYPVAAPGTSAHERGRAVDVPRWFVARLGAVASQVGLCHPWPETDPVHFELCRRTS